MALLEKGANIEARDNSGKTPLIHGKLINTIILQKLFMYI